MSTAVRQRLEAQGSWGLDDATLQEIGPWLRWSQALCPLGMLAGVAPAAAAVCCGIATVWLVVTGWLFHTGATMLDCAPGIPLILVAGLVNVTHICIRSMIHNAPVRPQGAAPSVRAGV